MHLILLCLFAASYESVKLNSLFFSQFYKRIHYIYMHSLFELHYNMHGMDLTGESTTLCSVTVIHSFISIYYSSFVK